MTVRELLNLLPQFIKSSGLKVFILDGFPTNMIIDTAAILHVLQQTGELTKLCIRHMDGIKSTSLADLIDIVTSIIRVGPPRLTELDLAGIGGSKE